MTPPSDHVVVLGAGFAGLAATRALVKAGYRVTLVDRHPYTTFQPLLYQVATGGLNPGDVTYSLRTFVSRQSREVGFRRGAAVGVDPQERSVTLDDGRVLTYDRLVIASGVTSNDFGLPGVVENTLPMYTRAQSLAVRDAVFATLERTAAEPDSRQRDIHIVIVGGGATGVEMAGSLAELRTTGVPTAYPELDRTRLHVVLVERGPYLLAPFDESLRTYTREQLLARNVDVRLDAAISEVTADEVRFGDGEVLPADLVIWAAGVTVAPEVAGWGLEQGRGGRILVDAHLRAHGHPEIYAVGDISLVDDQPLAQQAQPAMQMGEYAARHIVATDQGRDLAPFSYTDKGTMATIGRNAAVAEVKLAGRTWRIRGLPAWVLWVVVHLTQLLGGRNRIAAMLNLGARYLMWGSASWSIVGDVTERSELTPPAA